MKKVTKLFACILCMAVAIVGASALVGCGDKKETLTITGSTSVQPLMQKLAAAYEKDHKDVQINVSGGGSGVGVTNAKEGKNDFGMASRDLKTDGSEDGVVSKKIADDGISLVVAKSCTVTNVTTEQIKNLYVSGTAVDTIVAALSREEGSGTRDAFHELVGIGKTDTLHTGTGFEECNQTAQVKTKIAASSGNVVGYISMGSMDNTVKALQFNGVDATAANVKNGTYKLARPFNIVYKSEEGLSKLAKEFIAFILSTEGQAIVTAEGYIAL